MQLSSSAEGYMATAVDIARASHDAQCFGVQGESSEQQAECPECFRCPISLECMSCPVMLMQTGRIYDHSSFHQWLTRGGTLCPLTGMRLRNPIVLEPCPHLQAEIQAWAATKQFKIPKPAKVLVPTQPAKPAVPLTNRSASLGSEQAGSLRDDHLRERIAHSPAGILASSATQEEGIAPLAWVHGLAKSIWKGLVKKPQRPSTYMVTTSGVHRYTRGDLW